MQVGVEVTGATVEKGLSQLQAEIKAAPKQAQQRHEYKQPDIDDLDPFPKNLNKDRGQNQNQQSSTKEEDIEALFRGKLTQKEIQEKIRALKDSPELINNYIAKIEAGRREQEQLE